jgi:hypothetical protein
MNAEGSETEPLTLTEIAVYLGLIKNSQTNLLKKRVRKTSSKTQHIQSPIEYTLEDDDLTLPKPEKDETKQNDQQSYDESVASRKYALDEAEDERTVQEIDKPSSTKEKISPRIDYDSHEIIDLCINKIKDINNRLRYFDELKIDENYKPELLVDISNQRNSLLAEYKKINEIILILQNEVKDNSWKNIEVDLPQSHKKPNKFEEKYEPLPEIKPTDMDWFVKSILQLTRALNQRYPSENNSIQIPQDENWFVEMILQLIKLDEHNRNIIPASGLTPAKISVEEKPQQEKNTVIIKQTEDTINDRINSRVSSLMREIQEIENRYTKATQEDETHIEAQTYTPNSVRMSTESEKINERLKSLESKFNNLNVRKAQLASELTNITTSIDTLKQNRATRDFKNYPRRGVLALGFSAVILGLLILFPIQSPFLLQYIFGVGFALIGGGIIIDSIWAYFERRAHL